MRLYVRLAWRNLWRNKRRTLISVASVFFAVVIALVTRSMQIGSYDYMIRTVVRLSTGYVQVHARGYWDKRSIDQVVEDTPELRSRLAAIPGVTAVVPRLQAFSLAASEHATRGSSVTGIDPRLEDEMSGLKGKIVSGRYLESDDSHALVAEGLASYLGLAPGDTLVLYGLGYHGTTAAGKYPVCGIVRFTIPELNSMMVYLTVRESQYLFGMPGSINSLSVMLDHPRRQAEAHAAIRAALDERFEVMSWQEMMPEVVQAIEIDNIGGILMILILYIIIGFGIFGTVMMMTIERRREFGVLIAVGMKPVRLILLSCTEALFLSLIGVVAGILVAYPVMVYFSLHPIPLWGEAAEAMIKFGFDPLLPFSSDLSILLSQTLAVLVMALVSALYPALIVGRLDPVKAMRS